jgi:hypothetical protein
MDEDSTARSLAFALKSRGIDVITAVEANRLRYSDEEQLLWATSQGRTLYSSNVRDFYYLHTLFLEERRNHAGIILVQQQRYSIGEIMRGVLQLIATKSAEKMINQVEFIGSWIAR